MKLEKVEDDLNKKIFDSKKLENLFQSTKTKAFNTAQKIKFFIKDFFSKCDQIRSFLRIWSHLLKKSLIENFLFCAM